jgi:NADH-quinone oxidoreductase subunit N
MIQHYLPLLPELLVVVGGALALVRNRLPGELVVLTPLLVGLLALAAFVLELWLGAQLVTWARGAYTQDRFALFGKAAVLAALLVVLIASRWNPDGREEALPMAFGATLGGMVLVSATSTPLLWLALTGALAAGGAASLRAPDQRPTQAVLGGSVVLSGVGLLLVSLQGHSWTFTSLQPAVPHDPVSAPVGVFTMVAVTGLVAPLALLPLRSREPDEGDPMQSAVLAGPVAGAAVLASTKVLATVFAAGVVWGPYAAALGGLGALACGLGALASGTLRGLAGWLIGGQAAWLVAGLALHDQMGTTAVLLLCGALLLAAPAVPLLVADLRGPRSVATGLGRRSPLLGAALSVGLLSLVAIPPLAGFFGSFALTLELLRGRLAWALALALLGSALGLWAVLRVLLLVWLTGESEPRREPLPPTWAASAFVLGALVLLYGVFAYPIDTLAQQGAEALGLFY